MKKIIVFDMDDTLTEAKSPADEQMLDLLGKLLEKYKVAIITGGNIETISMQILSGLSKSAKLENLYVFPTIGTQMYFYNGNDWERKYAEFLSEQEADYIKKVLENALEKLDIKPEKTYGEIIENRGSQITYSALGQKAPLEEKKKFDPDKKIRQKIIEYIKDDLKDYSLGIGGTTSIDVTRKGLDKSYGIRKIEENIQIKKDEMLFIGDAIFPGGNDYPVKQIGVECIKVNNPEHTKKIILELIN